MRRITPSLAATLTLLLATGAALGPAPASAPRADRPTVVATTPILADFVRQVAGPHLDVRQLVPNGADPHSYEPTLADVKVIARAKAAFSNHLLLEEQSLIKTIRANLAKTAPQVPIAETAGTHGVTLIPLVENAALDTVWLGLRVLGRAGGEPVPVRLTEVDGPGAVATFITGTFGQPQIYFNSADGFTGDQISLPTNAHTHLSWSFTAPGVYQVRLAAPGIEPVPIRFAVGVDPYRLGVKNVLTTGHFDVAVDPERRTLALAGDEQNYDPRETVIAVPNTTVKPVPADPAWRFLGRPGSEVFILAQAVLGKHVHGEIDPHAWLDVRNAIAYVETIADTLVAVDPPQAAAYRKNAASYVTKLRQLHSQVKTALAAIPKPDRQLVTTHDGYGYLAKAYGLNVAGFVTPNPAMKPSAADLIALHRTIDALRVPAVFLEPNQANRADLVEVATSRGLRICPIHSDTFTPEVHSYVTLMQANVANLTDCLTKERP